MAKTLLAAPLAGLRGTIGALTYSANGSGTFVKAWRPPSKPQSENQMIERSYLARMPALWNALSSAQRTAWDTFAALGAQALTDSLGQTYYASGWNWFVKCNIRLLRVGRATISASPTIARPAAPTIDGLIISPAGTQTDQFVGGTPGASSTNPPQGSGLAADDTIATYWESAIGSPNSTWLYYYATTATPRVYNIYFPDNSSAWNVDDWTLSGYTGAAWDTLHSVTNFAVPTAGWHSFYFPNDTAYERFRFVISGQLGASTTSRIYEIESTDAIGDGSVIMYPEDEFTTGGTYDLILHISMTNSQSKIVQYPGYYEVLATQTPGRWFTDLQGELTQVFGTIIEGRRWFAKAYRQTSEGIRSAAASIAANTLE